MLVAVIPIAEVACAVLNTAIVAVDRNIALVAHNHHRPHQHQHHPAMGRALAEIRGPVLVAVIPIAQVACVVLNTAIVAVDRNIAPGRLPDHHRPQYHNLAILGTRDLELEHIITMLLALHAMATQIILKTMLCQSVLRTTRPRGRH